MKPAIHNSLITLITLGLMISGSAKAEPITVLLSLFIADKMASSSQEKKSPKAERISDWREQLSKNELDALESIRQHPAIGACIEKADNRHPIASYHARKVARFSASVQQHLAQTGSLPDVESLNYKWPAKAFQWCSKEAGIVASSSNTTLLTYAYNMARVVHFHHTQPGMVALATTNRN